MSVRANWHVKDDVKVSTDDPFAGVPAASALAPAPTGKSTMEQLKALVDREAQLFNENITCRVKDDHEATCHACPLRGTDTAPRALCDVGVAQEVLLTQLVVQRVGSEPR